MPIDILEWFRDQLEATYGARVARQLMAKIRARIADGADPQTAFDDVVGEYEDKRDQL